MINPANGLSHTMFGALSVAYNTPGHTVQLSPAVGPDTLRAIWNNGWGTLTYTRMRDADGRIVRRLTGAKLSRLGLAVYAGEYLRRHPVRATIPAPRRATTLTADPFTVIATGRRAEIPIPF